MKVLLNNCGYVAGGSRNHAKLYGSSAFYDLNTTTQAHLLTDLEPGDQCVVATRIGDTLISFDWFAFLCECRMPNGNRVFFGLPLWSEKLSEAEAAESPRYKDLFDRRGGIKRRAVISLMDDE